MLLLYQKVLKIGMGYFLWNIRWKLLHISFFVYRKKFTGYNTEVKKDGNYESLRE